MFISDTDPTVINMVNEPINLAAMEKIIEVARTYGRVKVECVAIGGGQSLMALGAKLAQEYELSKKAA